MLTAAPIFIDYFLSDDVVYFALIKQSHQIVCWKIISTLVGEGNVRSIYSFFFFPLSLRLVFPKAVVILDS